MAYKFQLGEFRASGSLIQEGSITSDGTLKLDGVADAAADVSADSLYFLDGDGLVKRESFADYAASVAGAGLAASSGVLSVDIDELDALGGASLHQTEDHFMVSDNGTEKKVTFSNLEDSIFANVSGDATIAAGGALTIAAAAVEHGMLNDNIISGQDELAHADIADADELMISDAGTIKRVGVDSLRDHFFGVVSGDATIADGGALTIAANAVEDSMVNDNVATGLAGDGLAASSGVLAVQVSGALKIESDKVGISGSFADNGLKYIGGEDSILGVELDIDGIKDALGGTGIAQADKFAFSDDGTTKTVTFSNLEDAIFGNISGDATVAAGGALTIAANAVEGSMINSNAAGNGLAYGSNALNLDLNELTAASIDVSADSIAIIDADDSNASKKESIADLATAMAGGGLVASNGAFHLDHNELGAAAVDVANDSFAFIASGDSNKTRKESVADLITAIAGGALSATSGVLAVAVSGAIKIDSDKIGLTGSIAGNGLKYDGGVNSISQLALDANPDSFTVDSDGLSLAANVAGAGINLAAGVLSVDIDELSALGGASIAQGDNLLVSDAGTEKKVTFSNLEDSIFANVSGDATVAAGGALTIAANAVEGSMLNTDVISAQTALASGLAATDELMVSDAGTLKRMDVSVLGDFLGGGAGITVSSGELSVSAAQTSITSIINSGIGKIGTAANQEYIDFSQSDEVHLCVNDAPALVATATGVTVEGDLTVLGTTTTVNSTTINISSSFTFEGPADDHETILTCATPVADTTIELPQLSAGTYYLPALSADPGTTAIAATVAELNIMDGDTSFATGITISDSADGFVFNDGGVMKQLRADEVKGYVQGLDIQNIDDSGTLKRGFNYFSSLGGAESCTLPASPVVGDIVYVKAPSNCSSTNTITINKAGSQTIDGQTALVLESPYAAVSLCYISADLWSIF